METLIPILNNLQQVSEAVGDDGIKLPQIVVVGGQGSGKSSVLENIVGRFFLPIGTDIVTRTPLELHLVHSPREPGAYRRQEDGTLDVEEFGVFGHRDEIFTDFGEICSEIQRQTEMIAGKNKRIGNKNIELKLFSPRLPNLIFVDLPGLTKIPIGDQPDDVETQIKSLVLKFIQNADAIILVVVPANTDVATNESLKLAKDCDPKCERTLAVLTKVDLMNDGTDALDNLFGNLFPVKMIAVVNRSQNDIIDKISIAQVNRNETEFFSKKYPSLADSNGTSFLVGMLKNLLLKYIKHYLVEVKSQVEQKILKAEVLVDFYSDDDEEKDRGLMKIIREFSSAYSECIRESGSDVQTKNRVGGTPICHIIHQIFESEINEVQPSSTYESISTSIQSSNNPEESLVELLRSPIDKMIEPSLRCAELVFKEMAKLLWKCAYDRNLLIQKFPALRNKILVSLLNVLRTKRSIAEKTIRQETFYELSRRIVDIRRFDKKSDVLNIETFRTKDKGAITMRFIDSYFETARDTVYGDVTVTIMLLVNDVKNKVHDELLEKFLSPGTGRIFQGDLNVSEDRKSERKALDALFKARDIIRELKECC